MLYNPLSQIQTINNKTVYNNNDDEYEQMQTLRHKNIHVTMHDFALTDDEFWLSIRNNNNKVNRVHLAAEFSRFFFHVPTARKLSVWHVGKCYHLTSHLGQWCYTIPFTRCLQTINQNRFIYCAIFRQRIRGVILGLDLDAKDLDLWAQSPGLHASSVTASDMTALIYASTVIYKFSAEDNKPLYNVSHV